MANPTTRQELKNYCLRRLGEPVIKINVADTQLEDRIDDALLKFFDYHSEGTQKDYYRHEITQQDVDNKYITINDAIIYVTRMFHVTAGSSNMFSASWALQYSAFSTLSDFIYTSGVSQYVISQSNISMMQTFLAAQKQISFNRHMNRIYVHTDWDEMFTVGNHIVFEVYRRIDPQTYPDVYNDSWLKKYCTALFKQQWGTNLRKYNNVQLLNGVMLDGQQIIQEANAEIEKLDQEIIDSVAYPPMFFLG